jgi:hypothetical protein
MSKSPIKTRGRKFSYVGEFSQSIEDSVYDDKYKLEKIILVQKIFRKFRKIKEKKMTDLKENYPKQCPSTRSSSSNLN